MTRSKKGCDRFTAYLPYELMSVIREEQALRMAQGEIKLSVNDILMETLMAAYADILKARKAKTPSN